MYGQESVATTWAMANMNMIIHDMEGTIEIGDTFKNPKLRVRNSLQRFDRVLSNPMWNQNWFKEEDYDADDLAASHRARASPAVSPPTGVGRTHPRFIERQRPSSDRARHRGTSRGSGNANKSKRKKCGSGS
jgi:type I restriction enzyme M protein